MNVLSIEERKRRLRERLTTLTSEREEHLLAIDPTVVDLLRISKDVAPEQTMIRRLLTFMNQAEGRFAGLLRRALKGEIHIDPARIYHAYRESSEWRQIVRPLVLLRDSCRCIECGERTEEILHMNFAAWGSCNDAEVQACATMCPACQDRVSEMRRHRVPFWAAQMDRSAIN